MIRAIPLALLCGFFVVVVGHTINRTMGEVIHFELEGSE